MIFPFHIADDLKRVINTVFDTLSTEIVITVHAVLFCVHQADTVANHPGIAIRFQLPNKIFDPILGIKKTIVFNMKALLKT